MESYLLLKTLHILGAVLFLGNIIITGWWKVMANKTKNPIVIKYAQRQVTLTDFVFTATGATLVLTTGVINAVIHNISIMNTFWIFWALTFFVLSAIIWIFILIPIQIKQAKEAKLFTAETVISDDYWKREHIWTIFGIIATILPIISMILMVLKPV